MVRKARSQQLPVVLGFLVLMLTALAAAAGAQTREQRGALQKEVRALFQLSKLATFDMAKVSQPGGVYVIAGDGIQGEVSLQSGLVPTYIVEGKPRTNNGAGSFLNSLVSNTKREEPRALKKGERVYITDINVAGDGLRVEIMTLDTAPIIDQGRTRQVTYKAALVFQNLDRKLPLSEASAAKQLISTFLVSEAEASAPKTVELGQTFEQVEGILGKPERIAKLGEKTIYSYKDMKVIFTAGKVSDVE